MTAIKIRAPGLEPHVVLDTKTIKPLLGELQIVSPVLADKIEQAAFDTSPQPLELNEEETHLLVAAARVVSNSLVDDSELDRIARIAE